MGVIKRQGGKHTIVQYVGVVIGVFGTLFIYPLNIELYGFAQFLVATTFLFMPLSNLGIHALAVKFFPRFKNEDEKLKHSFFNYLIIWSFGAFLFFGGFMVLFKDHVIGLLTYLKFGKVNIFEEYYNIILVLVLLQTLIFLGRQQCMNYRRIVMPSVLAELSFKLLLPVAVFASYMGVLTMPQYALLYVLFMILVLISVLIYLRYIKAFSFAWVTNMFVGRISLFEMKSYALYSSLTKLGVVLIFYIDAFMITLILGAKSNGVFYIFLFMANVIHIPFKSINLISSPIISKSWENGDMDELSTVYKKGALNLTVLGLGVFLFLWSILPDLILLSPRSEELKVGLGFFVFLGLTKVIDAMTSVNEQILTYSPLYYVQVYFVVIMWVINITLNYVLIGNMGITGVAIASLISYTIYNLMKLSLIYFKYSLHPWSRQFLKVCGVAIVTLCCLYLARQVPNIVYRVILIGLSMLIVYIFPIIRFRMSTDFNQLFLQIMQRIPWVGIMVKNYFSKNSL